MNAEQQRLEDSRLRRAHWKRWGPYISERAWGTVREDYSADGAAWDYLPHDHARSRAYRWNEDGLAGVCDAEQLICLALACWNGRDPILKERLFGLSGSEGNHGEDVKECYYYLDNTPTHSYMKTLYRYPQAAFPYADLVDENRRRGRFEPEYELADTGVFDAGRYFDIVVEYAKAGPDDMLMLVTATNCGPDTATLHLLPTVWFRNTWSWDARLRRPLMAAVPAARDAHATVEVRHDEAGRYRFHAEGAPKLLFTENESNFERLYGVPNQAAYTKDAFHDCVVNGRESAVNPAREGTKAAAHYTLQIAPGEAATVRARLCAETAEVSTEKFGTAFDAILRTRRLEAEEFYAAVTPLALGAEASAVMRQAFAGLLWSKQFYHYDVREWLAGDPAYPAPPAARRVGRNRAWRHLNNADVISMPDKWEYPWYASWDLAFHCLPLALIDPDFAKQQLELVLRVWYMHPNGQIPAYEWAFDDVNPPVHAWATWRVYQIERRLRGTGDRAFLERVFHKLLLNFTWWVNRKDAGDNNVFEGGFLGLDNIGLFDRNHPLPDGSYAEQSDGTSWMAMYCLDMLSIALELARDNPSYEEVATKFLEHFVYIANAMNNMSEDNVALWDEEDGFYYDVLRRETGPALRMKVRSMVGLIPLFAVTTLDSAVVDSLPGFRARLRWIMAHRPDLTANFAQGQTPDVAGRLLISIVSPTRLKRILRHMLDSAEFLSPFGLRSLSRFHRDHPYGLQLGGHEYAIDYEPAESTTALFGGNSNWRGPVWMPLNYLVIEALQRFDYFLGADFQVEMPTGSGHLMNLHEVANDLASRLIALFLRDADGRRPFAGGVEHHAAEFILFHEYFHGDTGAGLGASHQTGWTGLIAKLLDQQGRQIDNDNPAVDH